jgi:hypothetical protein
MPVKPLIIAFVVLSCWRSVAAAADACQDLPPETPRARLAGLDPTGDPVLVDGRALRLVGIAPRQDAAEVARFATEIARWRDRDLMLVLTGTADRWGRLPARLLVQPDAGGGEPRDLATLMIEAGAAVRLPEAAHAGCGTPTRIARPASRTPAPQKTVASAISPATSGTLDGHDIAALKAHTGRLVAVEGRIASVGERTQRVYLNFSRRRGEAGAIVMPRRVWREMQDAGWTANGLSGKRVRARGVLSGQDGLLLDATSALALELID